MEGTTKTREQIEAPLLLLLQSTLPAASQKLVRMRVNKPHWQCLPTLPPLLLLSQRCRPTLNLQNDNHAASYALVSINTSSMTCFKLNKNSIQPDK